MGILENSHSGDLIYIYGIVESPCKALDGLFEEHAGVTCSAPRTMEIAGRSIIWGEHDGSEILQTRRRMLAHARALETAMKMSSVLPMRFGHMAESLARLERLLDLHSDAIDAQFEQLAGRAEIGIRVRFPTDLVLNALLKRDQQLRKERDSLVGLGPEAHFQRVELGRLVAEALDTNRLQAQKVVLSALKPLCAAHVLKAPEEDTEVLRLECLVEKTGIDAIAKAAEEAARRSGFADQAEPDVSVVGPVPPYHFVDLALSEPECVKWA